MDSDDEDVSGNDILDWYAGRVEEIWDTATDSAFSDLSSNLTEVFRQVMNNVKERSQTNGSTSQSVETNGHSSIANGHSPIEAASSIPPPETVTNVTMSSEQLMAMLEDDSDWLEDDVGDATEEEMILSVQLMDTTNSTEEDQKNVKGVSQETKLFLADSILSLCCTAVKTITVLFKFTIILFIVTVLIYTASLLHSPLQKWFLRHMQNHIYPSMRLLRLATLPWIQKYPSLSDWHEETCLISNPLYWKRTIDCWSCSQVETIQKIDSQIDDQFDFSLFHHAGIPLIFKNSFEEVTLDDIDDLYHTNKWQFLQGIGSFTSPHFFNVSDLFYHSNSLPPDSHVSWKITRVGTGRLFRKLFPRPFFIPRDTEVALHKHLFISGPHFPTYPLPTTEFANVWIAQGSGARTINLIPSVSCEKLCKPIKANLNAGDLLYYNWQFWNPESEPTFTSDSLSVTYIGSFY